MTFLEPFFLKNILYFKDLIDMINYTFAKTNDDIEAILALQKANLKENVSKEEAEEQGFVTCNHTFEVLKIMNHPHPHIIAKHNEELIGYALVMMKDHSDKVPEIVSMFNEINKLKWNGKILKEQNYVIMGQICIAKNYRGKGVFSNLYQTMFNALKAHFSCLITDIATSNKHSVRAHQKVGFKSISTFKDDLQEWVLVLKDLS